MPAGHAAMNITFTICERSLLIQHADEDSENTRAAYEHLCPHHLSVLTLDHCVLRDVFP